MATAESLPQNGTQSTEYLRDNLTGVHPVLFSTGRNLMTYIQISEEHDAIAFLELAKSGSPVRCLPQNSYVVSDEHLQLLKRKRIPFKELQANSIRLPKTSRPHDEKI